MSSTKQLFIDFGGQSFLVYPGESVLDTLLRNGIRTPFGCRAGACQSCTLKADEQSRLALSQESQAGLTPLEKSQGLFLACRALPTESISIVPPKPNLHPVTRGVISAVEPLNASLNIYGLSISAPLAYRPGQFLNLRIAIEQDQVIQRSYSTAASENHGTLQFHIKILPGGKFSHWLQHVASIGDEIELEGPHGQCYLTDEDFEQRNIVLAATGTGLAPLTAILAALLAARFTGNIHLCVGNRARQSFYAVEQLLELANTHANLHLHLLTQYQDETQNIDATGPFQCADIYQFVKQLPLDFAQTCAFICGGESFVQKMRKCCFMAGMALRKIRADAFVAT